MSSFWDAQLTLLTFFMVAIASLTVALWSGGIHGTFDDMGLVLWGPVGHATGTKSSNHVRATPAAPAPPDPRPLP